MQKFEESLFSPQKIALKLKLLFLPFVVVAVVFVLAYTFLHWQLFLVHTSEIKEEITELWLPLTLPWIVVLIWLRRRIRLLEAKTKKEDLFFLLYMIASFTIATTTLVAQKYIKTATGKLRLLESIGDINSFEATKYYSIKKYYADKHNLCFKNTSVITGKYNRRLTYHIYIACPVYEVAPSVINSYIIDNKDSAEIIEQVVNLDTLKNNSEFKEIKLNSVDTNNNIQADVFKKGSDLPKAWLCFKYEKEIDNNLSKADKHLSWMAFYNKTYKDFYSKNIDSFTYAERLGNNRTREKYREAISNCNVPVDVNNTIILEPENKPFADRNGDLLPWIFGAFAIGAILFLIGILSKEFDEEKLNSFLIK